LLPNAQAYELQNTKKTIVNVKLGKNKPKLNLEFNLQSTGSSNGSEPPYLPSFENGS